jgi:hypothetical protein
MGVGGGALVKVYVWHVVCCVFNPNIMSGRIKSGGLSQPLNFKVGAEKVSYDRQL